MRANSRHYHSRWRDTLETLVLIFSDQQLITGLAICVAGFVEAFKYDLSSLHWQIIVYLAWTSSTVHLISLSLLRKWLLERPFLRNLRVFGMSILAILLMIALKPLLNNNYYYWVIPVRCFWDLTGSQGSSTYWQLPHQQTANTVISYLIILTGYSWKICDVFESSRTRFRRWFVCAPTLYLQGRIKRRVSPKPARWTWNWACSRVLIYAYIQLLLVCDILESFIFTLFLLLSTLLWGTIQILKAREIEPQITLQGEREFTFGQTLALLLLLQPISAVIEHFANDKSCESPFTRSHKGKLT